jgi:hypothetical protein
MQYLVSMDHNSMAVHLTRMTVKGFKKCCVSNGVDETDVSKLWNVRGECEGDGNSLIGKGRTF